MANVIQAARWMSEGKRVRRPQIPGHLIGEWDEAMEFSEPPSHVSEGREYMWEMSMRDLLADDWEVVEEADDIQ